VFAVYVDVRYETKGLFAPDMLDNSRSYREFIGYVIVTKNSTMELTINETLRHSIDVVVSSSFVLSLRLLQQHFVFSSFSVKAGKISLGAKRQIEASSYLRNKMLISLLAIRF